MGGFGRKGQAAMQAQQLPRPKSPKGAIRFDVTPNPWKLLFTAFACVFCVLILLAFAVEGRGLILVVIPLGPTAAQIFYVFMALVCLAYLVQVMRGFVRSFGGQLWMTLDQHAITGPTKYSGTHTVRIAFSAVNNVELRSQSDDQYLVITGRDGRKIKVSSANFREAKKWPSFLQELDRRLNGGGS
ncbi:hypothetical protein [uncultured Erythrobacter sp.]|uniref:hypothetical protein n=1 Tax=uncultured Erythrobacter sp. TaxID=263913 RepID=UPI0026210EAD|nr:hypothetical protein [uncultured Erythrobacter sp.]